MFAHSGKLGCLTTAIVCLALWRAPVPPRDLRRSPPVASQSMRRVSLGQDSQQVGAPWQSPRSPFPADRAAAQQAKSIDVPVRLPEPPGITALGPRPPPAIPAARPFPPLESPTTRAGGPFQASRGAGAPGPARRATLGPPAALGEQSAPSRSSMIGDDVLQAPIGQHRRLPEPLPPPSDVQRRAPALPPSPDAGDATMPELNEELRRHGGSYLYEPEGERLGVQGHDEACGHPAHAEYLRLPEWWIGPQPVTAFADFLGADPVVVRPWAKWPGLGGYSWEPRFVGYGDYTIFALAFEQGEQRSDSIGHRLRVDLDLRLTGTERFHVQFRPLGDVVTGGSYYQFSEPAGYVDNATAPPNRYWFEGQLSSMLGAWLDPYVANDITFVAGKFPFALHNALLINDQILGVAVSQNNNYVGDLSNLNWQVFYALDDTDVSGDAQSTLYGVNLSADRHRTFYELTYARTEGASDSTRDRHYAAGSVVKFVGRTTVAGRLLASWGEQSESDGQLAVLEANRTSYFDQRPLGFDYGVWFCNAFWASPNWTPIAGGNFNRLRTAFETNPLVRLAAATGPLGRDTAGVAAGCQLFRDHENASLLPEAAFEAPEGTPVWGVGLRYLQKTSQRSFLEVLGTANFSRAAQYRRDGVFVQHSWLF